jgi:hypothetical protein
VCVELGIGRKKPVGGTTFATLLKSFPRSTDPFIEAKIDLGGPDAGGSPGLPTRYLGAVMHHHRIPLLAAVCLIGAGCEIPTEAPIIDQRWILPFDEVTLDQDELLPPSVTIAGDFYDVNVTDASASETLANLCPSCAALDGLTVPAPAFQGTFASTDALPADVFEATVASGSIDVTLTNGLSFDPIAGGGSLTVTVSGASGGPVLGTLSFDGTVDTFAPGSVTMRTMTLSSGTIDGAIETTVEVDSPGGQVATIDVSDQVQVTAVTTSLLVSSVTVDVVGRSASLSETDLNINDLNDGIIDAIQSGSVVLDVTNPFGVSLTGSLTIGTVTKDLLVPVDATSNVEIAYTGDELRQILGEPDVTFAGNGVLAGGPAVVAPSAMLSIDPTIDLIIRIGG